MAKAAKYVCDHKSHAWCNDKRGSDCEHAHPHEVLDCCTRVVRPCVCWGVMSPNAGSEETLDVKCRKIK